MIHYPQLQGLDKHTTGDYYSPEIWSNLVAAKYDRGQKVIITPVKNQHLSPRGSDLERHAGQIGEVVDYYWVTLDRGAKIFYVYTVRIGDSHRDVVLHEDELKAYIPRGLKQKSSPKFLALIVSTVPLLPEVVIIIRTQCFF